VGLYDLVGDRLERRSRLELDVSGAETPVPVLVGQPAADVLLLNDDDLTYAKIRLDERSMATVVRHISGFDGSLARALCWAAAWDMVRDAELAARDYVALANAGLPGEADINLVTATHRQAHSAAVLYADPAWRPTGLQLLADAARGCVAAAEPGGGFQLAWARAFAATAKGAEDLAVLRGWLDGRDVPAGLTVDTELRWTLLEALVAAGAAGSDEVEAELDRDRTASGERAAAQAHALVPTPESKAETWRRLTSDEKLPNWLQRSLLLGFQHPLQTSLTEPYAARFFDVVAEIWATRDSEPAQEFVFFAYPTYHVSQATVDLTDAWLAAEGHPAPLRRLVAEGRDSVLRALKARARDAQVAG
jgi:aminopeptidase N